MDGEHLIETDLLEPLLQLLAEGQLTEFHLLYPRLSGRRSAGII